MVLTTDRERLKTLLIETITLLCKNGLDFENEFSVDALIGITLDQNDVFLVTIKETFKSSYDNNRSGESGSSHEENEGERLSDVSFHSEFLHADFPANAPQVTSDCRVDCGRLAVTSIENDTRAKLPSAAVSQQKQTSNPSRKNFLGAVSLPKDGNHLPIASASSPSDDDVGDLEDVIPVVSLQKDVAAAIEEPPKKRQHSVEPTPRKKVHSNTNSQEAIIQDIITECKSEPLDVIKLENSPVNESGCSVRQDNSNFLYNAVYENEANARFDPAFMNLYGQENLLGSSAVPGCSSWPMNVPPASSKSLQDQDHGWIENSFSAVEMQKQVPPSDLSGPTSNWNLSSSVGYTGERLPYKCSVCNKKVKLLRDLRAHMTAKHNLEQGFECHICGSTSTYKHNLLRHLRTVHGIKLDQCNMSV